MEAFVLRIVRSLQIRDRVLFIFARGIGMKIKRLFQYFSLFEWILWTSSVTVITVAFFACGNFYPLTLIASLIGVTSLIFIAKGNVIGQFLIIVFSILYAIISIRSHYYGEMITYLFMSAPAAIFACISWLKNPAEKGKNEVKVATMSALKWICVSIFALVVTVIFYFILRYFKTANLIVSTISIATSFFAAALLFLRSPFYAISYAANDVVLIVLWISASLKDLSYLPMVICFLAFLCNDVYGFINWLRMQKRQSDK